MGLPSFYARAGATSATASRTRRMRTTAIAVGLTLAAAALANVLVSNLAEPERAATAIGNNPNSFPPPGLNAAWYWAAQSFVTDGQNYTLDSVDAFVGDETAGLSPLAIGELRADVNGAIGPVIATFTVPSLAGPRSSRTFVPDSAVMLDPNTTYWFLLGVAAGGDGGFLWGYADTQVFVGPGSLGQWAFSEDSGLLWSYGTDFPFLIAVNATAGPVDTDGDGVPDVDDVCPASPPGAIVDSSGRSKGDFDLDCDVDLDDFAVFQKNFSGPG